MTDNGVININKPKGLTSHDVVAKIRKKLGIKRVGHTGTLDPMAEGVLPVCFGKATRIIEYYDADFKTYEAEMKLGIVTDTLDTTGTVIEEKKFKGITEETVRRVCSEFKGRITQTPPKYSALKVNGKRLYEYARLGEEVEIKKREIFIEDMLVDDVDIENGTVKFTVCCSKGTYIRSICDDIGKKLGCGACMSKLTRTASGCFHISDAVELSEFMEADEDNLHDMILEMDDTLINLGIATLKKESSYDFINGRKIDVSEAEIVEEPKKVNDELTSKRFEVLYRIYDRSGSFMGIASIDRENGSFDIEKVIYR